MILVAMVRHTHTHTFTCTHTHSTEFPLKALKGKEMNLDFCSRNIHISIKADVVGKQTQPCGLGSPTKVSKVSKPVLNQEDR